KNVIPTGLATVGNGPVESATLGDKNPRTFFTSELMKSAIVAEKILTESVTVGNNPIKSAAVGNRISGFFHS
uniref:Uncharacterized protein n=1 Tax=Romanomermis culicivorax TaxID=13658 RepID=A0A915J573_ROMCU